MKIPKYVEKLLDRRRRFDGCCAQLDEYCERIGVDMCDNSNSVITDVTIYCEPANAYMSTKSAIEKALKERK